MGAGEWGGVGNRGVRGTLYKRKVGSTLQKKYCHLWTQHLKALKLDQEREIGREYRRKRGMKGKKRSVRRKKIGRKEGGRITKKKKKKEAISKKERKKERKKEAE